MTVHYLLIENVDLTENKTEAGPQTVKCSFYKEMSKLSYKLSLRLKMNLFLRPPSEMVHNKKQHEKYQNVDEVVKEDHENQTNDGARNVSTHGRSNKMWCSEWKRQKVILDDAGWSAGAGTRAPSAEQLIHMFDLQLPGFAVTPFQPNHRPTASCL